MFKIFVCVMFFFMKSKSKAGLSTSVWLQLHDFVMLMHLRQLNIFLSSMSVFTCIKIAIV